MTGSAKIFEWVPGYLAWLNLKWQPEGLDHHLAVIRRASGFLEADVCYWSTVLRDDNWRAPLVGCACVIASKNRGFFGDLCYRFTSGSMVAPQLVVAIGLIHPTEAISFFRAQLDMPILKKDPRRVVSIQTALARLGGSKESEIAFDGWSSTDRDDAELAHTVVGQHWDFWSARL